MIVYTSLMKILIIEDDPHIAELIRGALVSETHTVEIARDGADGSFLARSFEYDLIILDYALPKKNGIFVCKEVRDSGRTTPIIFLSVTEDVETKVRALEAGADDYMTKPFLFRELNARIMALSRRPSVLSKPILRIHDLVLDTEKHIVLRANQKIRPTKKEFSLLEYLMRNPGKILSRAVIMEHVWTADSNPFSNTIEAHIRNLRKKINFGNHPDLIVNIPGRGYIIDSPANLKRF